MSRTLTVLIVGGYGRFGGRLVELLQDDARLQLLVAGRNLAKAVAFCRSRGDTAAALVVAKFDREGDLDAQLRVLRPDIVVDASGPFQAYGERRYALIEASIAHKMHYLDLADAREFVAGVKELDEAAKQAGVFALSGGSSFPVLTAAAARRLSAGMTQLTAIHAGIAPSPYAGVGENVIRAIAGYAGQRTAIGSGEGAAYPFAEQMRFTIAPPGALPLKRTLFSLVDVPDPAVLKDLWPELRRVWVGAGPVPQILHQLLIGFAWLVRARLLRSLAPLAPLMHYATNHLRWGEHRGGMFVEVRGQDASGGEITRSWHMIAEGDDGPLIPSMAAAAIIRNLLDGRAPAPGARASVSDLDLEDYEKQFAGRRIVHGIREAVDSGAPLYRRILGDAWHGLPSSVRELHSVNGTRLFAGEATVERGRGWLARAVAATIGFPSAGENIPVIVRFDNSPRREKWTRNFAGRTFSSLQFEGKGAAEHLLCERFGAIMLGIALVRDESRLVLVPRRWSIAGVPMPLSLCPRADAYEAEENGKFRFHVAITMPLVGLIVRYRGWLAPKDEARSRFERVSLPEL